MRVDTLDFVYTLYVSYTNAMTGETQWTMHAYRKDDQGYEHWLGTQIDASDHDPFKSTVTYNAWQ